MLTSLSASTVKTHTVLSKEPEANRCPSQFQSTVWAFAECAVTSVMRLWVWKWFFSSSYWAIAIFLFEVACNVQTKTVQTTKVHHSMTLLSARWQWGKKEAWKHEVLVKRSNDRGLFKEKLNILRYLSNGPKKDEGWQKICCHGIISVAQGHKSSCRSERTVLPPTTEGTILYDCSYAVWMLYTGLSLLVGDWEKQVFFMLLAEDLVHWLAAARQKQQRRRTGHLPSKYA